MVTTLTLRRALSSCVWLLPALVLVALPATAAPGEDIVERNLRLVKPALVRIESHATATVSAATIGFDDAALEGFARRDVRAILDSGRRFPSVAAAEQVVIADLEREFVTNPAPYLKLAETVSDPYEATRVGSGWVVDGDGTIVTAADALLGEAAVNAAATEEERSVISASLDDVSAADLGLTAAPFGDAEKSRLVDAALARVVPTIKVSDVVSRTTVQLGSAVPGQHSGPGVFADAAVVVTHPDPHGTGLAVLRVPGKQLVALPLAYGASLTAGRPVVVVGYPAAKAESVGVAVGGSTPVGPEAVPGAIGETRPEGAATDAGFTAGVIGGAVVDAEGRAVGVAVKREGVSAVVSVGEVTRVLGEAKAKVRENAVTKDYRKAAGDMSRHWYKRALPVLRRLSVLSPDLPWVDEQVQEATQQIAQGQDASPADRAFGPIAVAAVLFAVNAVAVATVLRRRVVRAQRQTA